MKAIEGEQIPALICYNIYPSNEDKEKIAARSQIVHNARPDTPFKDLPTTSEISKAYGYDPKSIVLLVFVNLNAMLHEKRIGERSQTLSSIRSL